MRPPSLTPRRLLALGHFLISLFLWLAPHTANSLDCQALTPVKSGLGYLPRSHPARCEGFYTSDVSATSYLEVVSLLYGQLRFDDSHLEISVSAGTVSASERVRVRALALPVDTYYRMDAELAPSDTLSWPLETVIAQAELDASEVGVFGWIDRDSDERFEPFDSEPVVALVVAPDEEPRVELKVRTLTDLEKLEWRWQGDKEWVEVTPPDGWPPVAGDTLSLELPAIPAGPLLIDFRVIPGESNQPIYLYGLRVLRPN